MTRNRPAKALVPHVSFTLTALALALSSLLVSMPPVVASPITDSKTWGPEDTPSETPHIQLKDKNDVELLASEYDLVFQPISSDTDQFINADNSTFKLLARNLSTKDSNRNVSRWDPDLHDFHFTNHTTGEITARENVDFGLNNFKLEKTSHVTLTAKSIALRHITVEEDSSLKLNATETITIRDILMSSPDSGDLCELYLKAPVINTLSGSRFQDAALTINASQAYLMKSSYDNPLVFLWSSVYDNPLVFLWSSVILNAPSGQILSQTPGNSEAALLLIHSNLKLAGGTHFVDGHVSLSDNTGFDNSAIGPETTLSITNTLGEAGYDTYDQRKFALRVFSYSNIDFSKLHGEFRTRSSNAYDGYLLRENEPSSVPSFAICVGGLSQLILDKATYRIYGPIGAILEGSLTVGDQAKSRILGDIFSFLHGSIDITLNGGSYWEGMGDDFHNYPNFSTDHVYLPDLLGEYYTYYWPGFLKLTMAGGTWKARGKSFLSELHFNNEGDSPSALALSRQAGSLVDLTEDGASSIFVNRLRGSKGTFKMSLNPDRVNSDMLYFANVETDSDAQFTIDAVIPAGTSASEIEGLRFATTGRTANENLFKVTSQSPGFYNVHFDVKHEDYDVTKQDENTPYNAGNATNPETGEGSFKPGNELIDATFGDGGMNWYLANPTVIDDNGDVDYSDTGKVILATARSRYWGALDLDRLQKRVGEQRFTAATENADHGLWVRYRHSEVGTDAGVGDFDTDKNAYQIGYDLGLANVKGLKRFGVALDYMDGDTDYRDIMGTGVTDRFGVTAYTTWYDANNWYVDLVGKWGRLHNSFDIVDNRSERVTASYRTQTWSASAEVGRKFSAGQSGWFIEPQAQLQYTYATGATFRTNQGTKVDQKSFNSVVSRVGFRLGHEWKNTNAYVKADWLREWAGKERMSVADATTNLGDSEVKIQNRGNWFDMGLGFQRALSKRTLVYLDAEYQMGNDLKHSFELNAGVRWAF